MTGCDEVASLLALEGVTALAPELLAPDERAPLASHLAGCAACAARSAAFAGAVATLAVPDAHEPAGFDAVLARLAAGEDPALTDEADGKLTSLPGDEGALPAPAVKLVIALGCTYCHDALLRVEAAYCASCLAPHHVECHQAHGRCAAPGCEETRVVRPLDAVGPFAPRRRGWGTALVGGVGAAAAVLVGIAAFMPVRTKPGTWGPRVPLPAPTDVVAAAAPVDSGAPATDELLAWASRLLEHGTGDERQADLIRAEEALREVLRRDPADTRALLLLGRLLAQRGDFMGALGSIDRALAVDPGSAHAYFARAEVSTALGRLEEAARDLARGRELSPSARFARAQVRKYDGPEQVLVRYGPEPLRVGDELAVQRDGRLAIQLTVLELTGPVGEDGVGFARCREEPLAAGAVLRGLDDAVLVTDEAVWARARDRARRERVLDAIERRRDPGGLRVLYVEATAGRTWAATRDALLRSRSLEARTWLVSGDPTYVQRASPEVTPLTAPPTSLLDYDVVVVGGDVPAGLLDPQAVERFLATGGGLVLLPGQDGLTTKAVTVRGPLAGGRHDERGAARPTFREGLSNVARLLGARGAEVELPQLLGVQAATAAPGARVLAQDEGGRPLVALAKVGDGDGRVVQIGADDLWRWETAEGGADLLQVFWLEVVGAASGEVWRERPTR